MDKPAPIKNSATKQKNKYAILSILFGLAAILIILITSQLDINRGILVVIGLLIAFPIVALVLGLLGLKSQKRTLAIIGVVLASLELAFFLAAIITGILVFKGLAPGSY